MLENQNVVADRPDAFRILVADDDPDALEEYALALQTFDPADDPGQGLTDLESELFGDVTATPPSSDAATYELEFCQQGDEAIDAVQTALAAGRPFAVAFLDFRMPPGPDGGACHLVGSLSHGGQFRGFLIVCHHAREPFYEHGM